MYEPGASVAGRGNRSVSDLAAVNGAKATPATGPVGPVMVTDGANAPVPILDSSVYPMATVVPPVTIEPPPGVVVVMRTSVPSWRGLYSGDSVPPPVMRPFPPVRSNTVQLT